MVSERLEVRLDSGRRRALQRVAQEQGVPVSALIRQAVDIVLQQQADERRLQALKIIMETTLEYDQLEPDELSKELSEAHDPGLP